MLLINSGFIPDGQTTQQPQEIANPNEGQPRQITAQLPTHINNEQKFVKVCQMVIPNMVKENPYHKDLAGCVFYDYVKTILSQEKASKVTGMLIDLPIEDIKDMMSDWRLFELRVKQADEVLSRPRQQ